MLPKWLIHSGKYNVILKSTAYSNQKMLIYPKTRWRLLFQSWFLCHLCIETQPHIKNISLEQANYDEVLHVKIALGVWAVLIKVDAKENRQECQNILLDTIPKAKLTFSIVNSILIEFINETSYCIATLMFVLAVTLLVIFTWQMWIILTLTIRIV